MLRLPAGFIRFGILWLLLAIIIPVAVSKSIEWKLGYLQGVTVSANGKAWREKDFSEALENIQERRVADNVQIDSYFWIPNSGEVGFVFEGSAAHRLSVDQVKSPPAEVFFPVR